METSGKRLKRLVANLMTKTNICFLGIFSFVFFAYAMPCIGELVNPGSHTITVVVSNTSSKYSLTGVSISATNENGCEWFEWDVSSDDVGTINTYSQGNAILSFHSFPSGSSCEEKVTISLTVGNNNISKNPKAVDIYFTNQCPPRSVTSGTIVSGATGDSICVVPEADYSLLITNDGTYFRYTIDENRIVPYSFPFSAKDEYKVKTPEELTESRYYELTTKFIDFLGFDVDANAGGLTKKYYLDNLFYGTLLQIGDDDFFPAYIDYDTAEDCEQANGGPQWYDQCTILPEGCDEAAEGGCEPMWLPPFCEKYPDICGPQTCNKRVFECGTAYNGLAVQVDSEGKYVPDYCIFPTNSELCTEIPSMIYAVDWRAGLGFYPYAITYNPPNQDVSFPNINLSYVEYPSGSVEVPINKGKNLVGVPFINEPFKAGAVKIKKGDVELCINDAIGPSNKWIESTGIYPYASNLSPFYKIEFQRSSRQVDTIEGEISYPTDKFYLIDRHAYVLTQIAKSDNLVPGAGYLITGGSGCDYSGTCKLIFDEGEGDNICENESYSTPRLIGNDISWLYTIKAIKKRNGIWTGDFMNQFGLSSLADDGDDIYDDDKREYTRGTVLSEAEQLDYVYMYFKSGVKNLSSDIRKEDGNNCDKNWDLVVENPGGAERVKIQWVSEKEMGKQGCQLLLYDTVEKKYTDMKSSSEYEYKTEENQREFNIVYKLNNKAPIVKAIDLKEGWNIVGISADFSVSDYSPSGFLKFKDVFKSNEIRQVNRTQCGNDTEIGQTYGAWSSNNGGQIDPPAPGLAFWIYSSSNTQIQVDSYALEQGIVSIPLDYGWNMISNPFTDYSIRFDDVHFSIQQCNLSDQCESSIPISEAVSQGWIDSFLYKHFIDGFYGKIELGSIKLIRPWEGYLIKTYTPNLRLVLSKDGESTEEVFVTLGRECIGGQQPPPWQRPIARIASMNTTGGNEISNIVGEIFDIDLTIEANGFTDASFIVEYDGTVIAPCLRDTQYPNDASKCTILTAGQTVPVTPASGLQAWTATVGNSINFDLVSFGEPFQGQVHLGTVTFKVLSTAYGKMTDITFNTDEGKLTVLGKINGDITSDYNISVSPARFVENHYIDLSPPTITVTETTPAPPQTWIRPGAAAPTPSSVTVKYRFTDNYYTTGNVKVAVYNSSNTMVAGTLSEATGVSINTERTFNWNGTSGGTAVSDGTYSIKIEATDPRGNTSSYSVPIKVDKTGPVISYPMPAANQDTGTLKPEIRVRIEENANGVGIDPAGLVMEVDGITVAAVWNSGTKLLTATSSLVIAPVNNHTVNVAARDKIGNNSTYQWSFTIDGTPPGAPTMSFSTEQILSPLETAMGITVPRDGKQYVSGNALMTATARDNTKGIGIQRIELFVNSELIGTQSYSTPPSEATGYFFWNTLSEQPAGTRKYPDGQYTIGAVAYDLIGNRSATASVTVFVDNTKPVVSSVVLSNSGYFSTTGNSAIKSVEIAPAISETSPYGWKAEIGSGDKTLGTWSEVYSATLSVTPSVAAGTITWDGKNSDGSIVEDGEYKYYITALDAAAQAVSQWEAASGTIVIDSATPTVTLFSPVDGDILAKNILFESEASDGENGSGIARAEFSRNLTDVEDEPVTQTMEYATDSGHYEYMWTTTELDDGIYEIVATAYDLAGNYFSTSAIELSVANRPAAIMNVSDTPDPFSPTPPGNSPKTTNTINFKIVTSIPTLGVDWNVSIGLESEWTPFMTFSGNISSGGTSRRHDIGPLVWDGRNNDDTETAVDGFYKYIIFATTTTGATASVDGGTILVDHTPPVIQEATATPDFFNPDGNGVTDNTIISARIIEANKFKARFEISGNGYAHSFEAEYIPGPGGETVVSMPWDGKAKKTSGETELVPDGDYTFVITAEDTAGNTSNIAEGMVTKDNPPVITLKKATVAFSPDRDGSIDIATVDWSADQEGLFTLKVYDAGMQLINALATDTSNVGMVGATMTITWDGLKPDGTHFDEGIYWIEITGRDANSRKENPCVPKKAETILDVTDPELTAFYPYEDEFTPLHPKLKVNVTDNLSGFGNDSQWASEHTDFYIDSDSQEISANADMKGPIYYRAWAYTNGDLAEGPHQLKATAMDIAGNTGTMNWMRFVAIPALEDNFSTTTISTDKWLEMSMSDVSSGVTGSASLQSGKLVINSSTTIPDKASTQGIDTYGYGVTGKLVPDISRPEVIVEATDVTIDGSGSMYLGGILLSYASLGAPGNATVGGVGLLLAYSEDYPEGQTYAIVLRGLGTNTAPVWAGPVSTPADLKIHYEEGQARFYVNGQLKKTLAIQLSHAITGAYAGAGFDEDDYTHASVHLVMEGFSSNLAAPVVKKITLTNAERPDERTIHPGEEHYELTVEGTPWQKHVLGRIINFDGISSFGIEGIQQGTIGDASILEEVSEGGGIYKTPAPVLLDTIIDKTGNPTKKPMPFASNDTYSALPFVTVNGIIGEQLLAITEAVTSVELENTDYPPGYSYIQPNEHYRITAETRPGDWDIEAYILSWDALAAATGPVSYPDAVLTGPLTMVKTGDGKYEVSGTLDNIAWHGASSTRILAWVKYGMVKEEEKLSENMLNIGQPAILYATVNNNDRYGAPDVNIGETVEVTAKALPGQPYLVGFLANADNLHAPDMKYRVGIPFAMTESPVGSGDYKALVILRNDFDLSGESVTHLKALATTSDYTGIALSWNELSLSPQDKIAPAKPGGTVVVSGVQQAPAMGTPVSTAVTWTHPSANEDGTQITDLAGYNVYRVSNVPGEGLMTIISGSAQLQIDQVSQGVYKMDNTVLRYKNVDFNVSPFAGGAAGWYEKGTLSLAQLPLQNSSLIEPGKDVYAYTIVLVSQGVLYPNGALMMTVYSQEPVEEVDRWLRNLKTMGIASEDITQIVGYAKAFTAMPDGTFSSAASLSALDFMKYEKVNTELVTSNLFTDDYAYNGVLYSYAATAVDETLNESSASVIASVPLSSKMVLSAALANSLSSAREGYIAVGDEYVVEAVSEIPQPLALDMYLLNKAAIENRASFDSALIDGPVRLQPVGANTYRTTRTLNKLTDAGGWEVADLVAVVSVAGGNENITAAGILKRGIIEGTITPDKSEYIAGETISASYSAQNTSQSSLQNVLIKLQLIDLNSGEVLGEIDGPTIATWDSLDSIDGTLQVTIPTSITEERDYKLALVAEMQDGRDLAAETSVRIVPERVIITDGKIFPASIVPYQEPIISYRVTNQTRSTVSEGIITGMIVSPDDPSGTALATFSDRVTKYGTTIAPDKFLNMSSTFTPVYATENGTYQIILYYQKDAASEPQQAYTMDIEVEGCN